MPFPVPTTKFTPYPTNEDCRNRKFNEKNDETDVDCGGSNCQPCKNGKNCKYNSDCFSEQCGQERRPNDAECSDNDDAAPYECVCISTPEPTFTPTSMPTYSPPIVLSVDAGSSANSSMVIVDPTTKVTIRSEWISADPETTFGWSIEKWDNGKNEDEKAIVFEYGVTTSTPLTNEYLVIKPYVLGAGSRYTLMMYAVNRYNKYGYGYVNISAGRAPWNGYFHAQPRNGTTLSTKFRMETGNWTDEPGSFPLKYTFQYHLPGVGPVSLNAPSTVANRTTILPLGDRNKRWALDILVNAEDKIGATSKLNHTVDVGPPALGDAVNLVGEQGAKISSTLTSGDHAAANVMIQAGASLLNHFFDKSDDHTFAAAMRSQYIGYARRGAFSANDETSAESSAVSSALLTRKSPKTMKQDDKMNTLHMVAAITNTSKGLKGISTTGATASVGSISNLMNADLFGANETDDDWQDEWGVKTVDPTAPPSLAPSSVPTITPMPTTPRPSAAPTLLPSSIPTLSFDPTLNPTLSVAPTLVPTSLPTEQEWINIEINVHLAGPDVMNKTRAIKSAKRALIRILGNIEEHHLRKSVMSVTKPPPFCGTNGASNFHTGTKCYVRSDGVAVAGTDPRSDHRAYGHANASAKPGTHALANPYADLGTHPGTDHLAHPKLDASPGADACAKLEPDDGTKYLINPNLGTHPGTNYLANQETHPGANGLIGPPANASDGDYAGANFGADVSADVSAVGVANLPANGRAFAQSYCTAVCGTDVEAHAEPDGAANIAAIAQTDRRSNARTLPRSNGSTGEQGREEEEPVERQCNAQSEGEPRFYFELLQRPVGPVQVR
jgi:hypothetical protein